MEPMFGGRHKWIKHYSSNHQILLVGEGDFSFSLCLAMAFESAINIVATSLDTEDELLMKYQYARNNLSELVYLGASLFHGVDTTKMYCRYPLQGRKFDRIIFNFPHAGFLGKEDNPDVRHGNLVRGFFWNASKMLWPNGEIHVSHKVTAPFTSWKIEDLASECSLLLVGDDVFNILDYPSYKNKRGSGLRPDDPFPLGESRTFCFKLNPSSENVFEFRRNLDAPYPVPIQPQTMYHPISPPPQPVPYSVPQPYTSSYIHNYNNANLHNEQTTECQRVFGGYLNHVEETFGSSGYDLRQSVRDALDPGFEEYMVAAPGRSLSGYVSVLEGPPHHYSESNSKWLRELVARYGRSEP